MTLDRRVLEEQFGGDEQFAGEIACLFLRDYPELIKAIVAAVEASDGRTLNGLAHRLKGSVSSFGAPAAVWLAFRLEKMGKEANFEEAAPVLAELVHEMDRVNAMLVALSTAAPVP